MQVKNNWLPEIKKKILYFAKLQLIYMNPKPYLKALRQLIAKNELGEALQQLQQLLNNSPHIDEALHQSGRYEAIHQQIRMGTVNQSEAQLTENQIRVGLLELIQQLEKEELGDAARQELQQHAAGSNIIQKAEKIYNIGNIDKADFS